MGSSRNTARAWLKENGYFEIAEMIDGIEADWRAAGKRTRRNWWDVLSGDKNGNSREIYGRRFPVLEAAQVRQGKPVTENALKATENETRVPSMSSQGRWKRADDCHVTNSEEERELT